MSGWEVFHLLGKCDFILRGVRFSGKCDICGEICNYHKKGVTVVRESDSLQWGVKVIGKAS